ncbi:hypothetical protein SEA_VROOMVROOM_46 [Arthrobacter phage VroomVroom]|uniref:Uncharacterized protein n=1 Tax=Arthrobacter phage VroomVroom TaxID=3049371 RepID=A0AA49F9X0_9CAUD|nr:hypothetical protein SEA_VROOMVROOM_46 [Arthrobacter phage VroomVroom]
MSELIPDVRDTAARYLRLSTLLVEAAAVEYSAAPIPKPRHPDESGTKAIGGHGDPTQDIALDPRRLAVRHAADHARRVLREHERLMREAEIRLVEALDGWEGSVEDPQE